MRVRIVILYSLKSTHEILAEKSEIYLQNSFVCFLEGQPKLLHESEVQNDLILSIYIVFD